MPLTLSAKPSRSRPRNARGCSEPPARSDAETQGRRIQAIALEVASLRDVVEDIRTRVVDRPMTAAEAAGEAPLAPGAISLALEDVDMDALPAGELSDAEVRRFMRDYIDRAGSPEASFAPEPAHAGAAA